MMDEETRLYPAELAELRGLVEEAVFESNRDAVVAKTEKSRADTLAKERDAAKREADKAIVENASMRTEIKSLRAKLGHERLTTRKGRW